jgi:DNA modification methylase
VNGPYYRDESVTLWHGDCLDVLTTLPDASVDAVCTDPPYALSFMSRDWDTHATPEQFQSWCEAWSRECLRVLKPGGHMLAFGGSRTWHRLASAVEDAGFEVRDSIAWLYGSGFPKSLDVSKAIDKAAGAEREVVGVRVLTGRAAQSTEDKGGTYTTGAPSSAGMTKDVDVTAPATPDAERWQGWGTALKPAFEPIVVARKPLSGTVAATVLAHGTGALNIDACRVDGSVPSVPRGAFAGSNNNMRMSGRNGTMSEPNAAGRWPTNVVLDDTQAAALDAQSGERPGRASQNVYSTTPKFVAGVNLAGSMAQQTGYVEGYNDSGGASRFFPTFRYEAKAPTAERPRDGDTAHPTVKPLDLMRWLVRLVTPPGGIVLDPFLGSGTTAEACIIEGFRCIGIEREPAYLPLAVARLSKPLQVGLDFGESA